MGAHEVTQNRGMFLTIINDFLRTGAYEEDFPHARFLWTGAYEEDFLLAGA